MQVFLLRVEHSVDGAVWKGKMLEVLFACRRRDLERGRKEGSKLTRRAVVVREQSMTRETRRGFDLVFRLRTPALCATWKRDHGQIPKSSTV